jgi:hypothetical protein
MNPIDVQHYEQQHRKGEPHIVFRRYGEHLARLRAQANRRKQVWELMEHECFQEGQEGDWHDE